MNYSKIIEDLKKIVLPILEKENIELVELDFIKTPGKSILRLLVDKKYGGISLSDCAQLNEKIGATLETYDSINNYVLEVSSPGLDRPLKTKDDFLRCINRKIILNLSESINGKTEITGIIKNVSEDSLEIDLGYETKEISFHKIIKAKQIINDF